MGRDGESGVIAEPSRHEYRGQETQDGSQASDSTEGYRYFRWCREGGRTPLELLQTDFEFPKNTVSL
jgi:hypothetical protein